MKIEFTPALHNYLVDLAERRAKTGRTRNKLKILDQHELFMGAIGSIDFLNGETEKKDGLSCISPVVYTSVLRGELIPKIDESEQQNKEA